MFNATLPDHLLVELSLLRNINEYDEFGTLITNIEDDYFFTGTFQITEKEVLNRNYGIDIETNVYKLVTKEILKNGDIIMFGNDRYEIIENRISIYTDANIYLLKNILGGRYV